MSNGLLNLDYTVVAAKLGACAKAEPEIATPILTKNTQLASFLRLIGLIDWLANVFV